MSNITPTIYLRGINFKNYIQKYLKDEFDISPPKTRITKQGMNEIIDKNVGKDHYSGMFKIKDTNGNDIIIATTSNIEFQSFLKHNKFEKKIRRCERCLTDFNQHPIGYPLSMKECTFLTEEKKFRIVTTFWVEGCFCSYECCLSFVRLLMAKDHSFRDTNVRDSESMLKYMFKLIFGEDKYLLPCKDPRLLISNGGSLTKEDWSNSHHIYYQSERIITIPAKVEYIQLEY